jgi:hypothetical protein
MTTRSYTVIYTGAGEPIVHATGCTHNVRDSLQGVHTSEVITGSLTEVSAKVFSDFIDEGAGDAEDFVNDLRVKPCAR